MIRVRRPIEDLGPELRTTRRAEGQRDPAADGLHPGPRGAPCDRPGGTNTPGNIPAPNLPNLDKVKEALGSVADAVNDAVNKVGKALGAGAAESRRSPQSRSPDAAADWPAYRPPAIFSNRAIRSPIGGCVENSRLIRSPERNGLAIIR